MANGASLVPSISPIIESLQRFTPRARREEQQRLAGFEQQERLTEAQITGTEQRTQLLQAQIKTEQRKLKLAQGIDTGNQAIRLFDDELLDIGQVTAGGSENLLNNLNKLMAEKGADSPDLAELVEFRNKAATDPEETFNEIIANRDNLTNRRQVTLDQVTRLQGRLRPQQQLPKTANQRDFETFQRLKKTDPKSAKEFGQATGFVSKEGRELSSFLQKRLAESNDTAIEAGNNVNRFSTLANDFERLQVGGGLTAKWGETFKTATGQADAVSNLRIKFNAIRASQAVKNLPPGAASDVDVALALSGFPPENAPASQVASFLRGISKLEQFNEQFNTFRSNFISDKGSERNLLQEFKRAQREGTLAPPTPIQITAQPGVAQQPAQPVQPAAAPTGAPTTQIAAPATQRQLTPTQTGLIEQLRATGATDQEISAILEGG